MGAGVKAAEHGRYTTPTDDVRRRHGLLPPRTGLIYRIMMAHGGVPHSHGELIHRSAWNRNSAKYVPQQQRRFLTGLRCLRYSLCACRTIEGQCLSK